MAKIIAEYIWLDGDGNLRSKARTLDNSNLSIDEINNEINDNHLNKVIPNWNYDGSSTKQASGNNSEVLLIPCHVVPCPFRLTPNILVMCETETPDGKPAINNNRRWAKDLFDKNLAAKPWYGIEQEFFIMDINGLPYCWDENMKEQGQYYCSVGRQNAFGRQLIDRHYTFCLYSGLNISGINAEVAPGQWEYQIGPVEGIRAGDEMYLSRYILQRLGEEYNIIINFEPKPLSGKWNGSGCHTNYSTADMRENIGDKKGIDVINEAIKKLSLKHDEHMKLYGTGNELRMTGQYETSSYNNFTSGVADRGASIRIPRDTSNAECGYFEDRRPSSNMDPYLVTGILFHTTVIE